MLDILDSNFAESLAAPVRQVAARVDVYKNSALVASYAYTDALKNFKVERVGENGKFFGFGICQKINVKLRDKGRTINLDTSCSLKIVYYNEFAECAPYPTFYVTEVHRDENTNELSITAYDKLYTADKHTIQEVGLEAPYDTVRVAQEIALALDLDGVNYNSTYLGFNLDYEAGANFDGAEGFREVLNAIAETTQTIYYINGEDSLIFKRLERDVEPVFTISRNDYITLKSGDNKRLATIVSATELGDNVSASLAVSGSTQYMRDNPFIELREDVAEIVEDALAAVGGLTINQFDCSWRGNFLLELGDKIELITKDNDSVVSFVLDETIEYNGALSSKLQWKYEETATETETNPSNLGEALKSTFARVDKANKEIELLTSVTDEQSAQIGSIKITTDGIIATVEEIQDTELVSLKTTIEQLPDSVAIKIKQEGVENSEHSKSVETEAGFTFDDTGLTIAKSGYEIKTQITTDGMTVYKGNKDVLTANSGGVDAVDLHATTYLIVGENSRFENYGYARTGCFYIGN